MARKNLLQGLMEEAKGDAPDAASKPVATPRYAKGAIGAVSQSIQELKARSVIEVDPRMVDAAGVADRLEEDDADHAALMESIREYGQQVPVLLRPNPNYPERYQVVYGRRRLRAIKELGLPVKALIRDLDDRALILAQGQENTARKDLTFIERANFARQMRDGGYDRKVIGDALHVDKTVISRMLSVADVIPVPLIEAIGPAPSVGRDRWLALKDAMDRTSVATEDAVALIDGEMSSDHRFKALLETLEAKLRKPKAAPKVEAETVKDGAGKEIATAKWAGGKMTMTLKADSGFDRWLADNLKEIHRSWKEQAGE
jgi:ParB family chromosome partitioning protein